MTPRGPPTAPPLPRYSLDALGQVMEAPPPRRHVHVAMHHRHDLEQVKTSLRIQCKPTHTCQLQILCPQNPSKGGLADEDAGETRRGSASAGPSRGPATGLGPEVVPPKQRRGAEGLAWECPAPLIVTKCHKTRGITDAHTLTMGKKTSHRYQQLAQTHRLSWQRRRWPCATPWGTAAPGTAARSVA